MSTRSLAGAGALVAMLASLGCSSTSEHDDATAVLEGELGLNDVSILYPMPPSGERDRLMGASTVAKHGELLPASELARAPELQPDADVAAVHAALRVVGVRIDPCFPSLAVAPSPSCRFQVRLVLQPLRDVSGALRADDAAVHLFYDLPVGDFVTLVGELVAARETAAPNATRLDVHPILVSEGLTGPYASHLQTALLAVIGRERLTRMTFAVRSAGGESWMFGGFDYAGDAVTPIAILSSSVTAQTFANDTSTEPLDFDATVAPPLSHPPEDLAILYDSSGARELGDEALWPLYESILRIENPNHHSPASVDCVSCHTAQPARLWLDRNTALAGRASAFRYASPLDLGVTQPIADTTSALRAFGWLGDRPSVSARVVNESAAVAGYLNERLLR